MDARGNLADERCSLDVLSEGASLSQPLPPPSLPASPRSEPPSSKPRRLHSRPAPAPLPPPVSSPPSGKGDSLDRLVKTCESGGLATLFPWHPDDDDALYRTVLSHSSAAQGGAMSIADIAAELNARRPSDPPFTEGEVHHRWNVELQPTVSSGDLRGEGWQ